jgi:uncharacterized protein (TIGR02246 family)
MTQSPAMTATRDLYRQFVDGWNGHDARAIANTMDRLGILIGFDGTVLRGSGEVEKSFSAIFTDHNPHQIVAIERSVAMIAPTVCRYLSDVGFFRPEAGEIDEALNARQTLIATLGDSGWKIALLQTTPAAQYTPPGSQIALTEELRAALARSVS